MSTPLITYDYTSSEAVLPGNTEEDFAILFNASQEEVARNVEEFCNESSQNSELIVCRKEDDLHEVDGAEIPGSIDVDFAILFGTQ